MRFRHVVACLLILSACATSGKKIDQADLSTFKVGETTEQDVIGKLGEPNNSSSSTSGFSTLSYHYVHTQARAESFVPVVGTFIGGADSQSQFISFVFGPDGKLKTMNQSGGHNGVGTGLVNGSAQ